MKSLSSILVMVTVGKKVKASYFIIGGKVVLCNAEIN